MVARKSLVRMGAQHVFGSFCLHAASLSFTDLDNINTTSEVENIVQFSKQTNPFYCQEDPTIVR